MVSRVEGEGATGDMIRQVSGIRYQGVDVGSGITSQ
jgi:hypothetical protein